MNSIEAAMVTTASVKFRTVGLSAGEYVSGVIGGSGRRGDVAREEVISELSPVKASLLCR